MIAVVPWIARFTVGWVRVPSTVKKSQNYKGKGGHLMESNGKVTLPSSVEIPTLI